VLHLVDNLGLGQANYRIRLPGVFARDVYYARVECDEP